MKSAVYFLIEGVKWTFAISLLLAIILGFAVGSVSGPN